MAPLILVDPLPRTLEMICDPPTRARLEALGRLVVFEDGPMPDELVEEHLAEAVAIVGQTAMPAERLARFFFKTDEGRALLAGNAAHCVMPLDRLFTSAIGVLLQMSAHAVGWPVAESGSQSIARALA